MPDVIKYRCGPYAFSGVTGTALWTIKGIYDLPLFRGVLRREPSPNLRAPSPTDELINDFDATGFSLNWDPIGMVRDQLTQRGVLSAEAARQCTAGQYIRVVGLISHRQRPGTASGMLFMTMEDETGMLNLVVRPDLFERKRSVILGNNMLQIGGTVQRDGDSLSILCRNISVPVETPSLSTESRDFR